MQINDQQIAKFQELYKKNFGVEINKDQARDKGMRLICLFKTVYKPKELDSQKFQDNKLTNDSNKNL